MAGRRQLLTLSSSLPQLSLKPQKGRRLWSFHGARNPPVLMLQLEELLTGQRPRFSARWKVTASPEVTRVWSLPDDHRMPIRAARQVPLKFDNPGACPTLQPLVVHLLDLRQAFLQVPDCGPSTCYSFRRPLYARSSIQCWPQASW